MKYILLICMLLIVAACGEKAIEEDTGILETLEISEACDNPDQCCADQCKSFCKENNKVYAKHIVNGFHCPCWCD